MFFASALFRVSWCSSLYSSLQSGHGDISKFNDCDLSIHATAILQQISNQYSLVFLKIMVVLGSFTSAYLLVLKIILLMLYLWSWNKLLAESVFFYKEICWMCRIRFLYTTSKGKAQIYWIQLYNICGHRANESFTSAEKERIVGSKIHKLNLWWFREGITKWNIHSNVC
jgi:hypothetical protein